MSANRQIAQVLEAMPESVSLKEAIDRLYRAFKLKKAADALEAEQAAEDAQTTRLLRLLNEERVPEARALASPLGDPVWAQILAPARVTLGYVASAPEILRPTLIQDEALRLYAGQWVALRKEQIIDAHPRRSELRRRLVQQGPLAGIVFMKVEE